MRTHTHSFQHAVDAAALMSSVYEDHKDEDGFLYITYSGENTFGCSNSSSSAGDLELLEVQQLQQ